MRRFLVAALMLCTFVAAALAQSSTGRLTGTVSGPDGVIPGATVVVVDNATNREQTILLMMKVRFPLHNLKRVRTP
jgi:hypothetical protein